MPAWFRRKRCGYGWTPATWEGWVATLLFVLAELVLGEPRLVPMAFDTRMICIFSLVACLFAVAMATSERGPRT